MSSEPPNNYSEDDKPNQTDAELFLRLQKGETGTLATLYDRHAALVYGIAIKLLSNATDAEDLTQDIFLNLARKCNYDPQRGSLRTYLRILTRSRGLDRLRTRARRQQKLRNQALEGSSQELSASPMEEASQIERSQEVLEALEQLSSKEREVLRMAYYQGLSQSEIATRLSTAVGTVKSRSRRGLLKLRQALTHSGRES